MILTSGGKALDLVITTLTISSTINLNCSVFNNDKYTNKLVTQLNTSQY